MNGNHAFGIDNVTSSNLGHVSFQSYVNSLRRIYPSVDCSFQEREIPVMGPRILQPGIQIWKYNHAMRNGTFRESHVGVVALHGKSYLVVGNARCRSKYDLHQSDRYDPDHKKMRAYIIIPDFKVPGEEFKFASGLERQVEIFMNDTRNHTKSPKINGMWHIPGTEVPPEEIVFAQINLDNIQ